LLSLLVVASMVLAGCAKATPTPEAPPPTAVPPPTAAPPTAALPAFEPLPGPEGACDNGSQFRSIQAVDAYTVQFNMCVPDPAFLSKIAFSVFGIYSQEWLEETTAPGARLESFPGTGPYMFSSWVRGESITYEPNPYYWGTAPRANTLVFRWSTESAARLLELQAGTVDGIDNVGPDDFSVVQADANLQLKIRPALNVFYIAMNTHPGGVEDPVFSDVRVRQAVAMGIDRERIVDTFYPVGSEVASHFTPCSIPNGCVGDAWYDFDPVAARALLAEAGYPDGFQTHLYYRDVVRAYLPEVARVAEEIQTQLRDNLGIDAEIVPQESGTFIANSNAGALDGFHLLGWNADYPHVTNFLDFHFPGTRIQFGQPHPEIYEVLAQAAQIADPAEAEALYVQANNAIRELVPMVPVAHGGSALAYRADVADAHASPLGNEYFAPMDPGGRDTFVWMQNAEPISLFCADETDGESLRACEQVIQALYGFEVGGTAVEPVLAESCEPNDDLTVWTCTLRQGVQFSDGTTFDANDVVATFTAALDITSPLHIGNTGTFEYWISLWGNLINAPPME
jgi:ABC-type transport system substrate-binding protein